MVGFGGWVALLLAALALIVVAYLYLAGYFRGLGHYALIGIPADDPQFPAAVASMSDSLITEGASVQFWSSVNDIQSARLQLIASAQALIQFETFIMTPGRRSQDFANALIGKASTGIAVQVLVDAYGAKSLPDSYWRRLTNAGVEVRFFSPFSWRAPLDYGRRNHRKLLIVDQRVAMVGGAGIADRWDGKDKRGDGTPWYDFEVKWGGPVVGLLTGFFWQHWLSAGGRVDLRDHAPLTATPAGKSASPMLITPGEDPTTQDSPIRSLFQLCALSANARLWIASPYLLPDEMTCKMLVGARRQGVDVRIMTMGPKSDKPYVYHVSRERYGPLLQGDIGVYEYQPSMMHAKIMLVDNHWVSLGSANLDPRSFFHNDELNICACDRALLASVERFFEEGFSRSQQIEHVTWRQRPLREKLAGQLWNLFYWLL